MGQVYSAGLNRPPLKYTHIPDETIRWIHILDSLSDDNGFTVTDQGPFDWDNGDDLGQDNNYGWSYEEDDNFIVYYQKDRDAKWQGYAQSVLREANGAICELTDLMGHYYYASDMNGRKLSIYLANSPQQYASTINGLLGRPCNNVQNSIGMIITQVGPLGCLTHGIVLHPECFNEFQPSQNRYPKVLRHEMNHYVFFSSLNYDKNVSHFQWMSEGLAEYSCNSSDHTQLTGKDSIDFISRYCKLTKEFPSKGNAAYWAGESFFLFIEKYMGGQFVRNFIRKSYQHTTSELFTNEVFLAAAIPDEMLDSLVQQSPIAGTSLESLITSENISSLIINATPLAEYRELANKSLPEALHVAWVESME